MNIPMLSDGLVAMLHKAVRDAFDCDEGLPAASKKYGVREFSDWRGCADELESELKKRKIPFVPIHW